MVNKLSYLRHKRIFANPSPSDKRGLPKNAVRFSIIRGHGGYIALTLFVFFFLPSIHASTPDTPFLQDRSEQFPALGELTGATLRKVHVNKDGIVYVLTDRGMARLFENKLALDRSFRPLIGKKIFDTSLANGEIFYLLEDRLICNGFAGRYAKKLPLGKFDQMAVSDDNRILLTGAEESILIEPNGKVVRTNILGKPVADGTNLFVITTNRVAHLSDHWAPSMDPVWTMKEYPFPSTISVYGTVVGSHEGIYFFGSKTKDHFPVTNITCSSAVRSNLWFGSTRGAFRLRNNQTDYYASRRWLLDDEVVDIEGDHEGNVYVLSKTGLNKIIFEPTTLEQKAIHYQKKIRERHIRFGFCSELYLDRPGDITSAQMIDTDNDGTWSNYYMASQAFRFGATSDPEAHAHAWETFDALERLESINPIVGFPSRTFERIGYRNSDPDRWYIVGDDFWEWKGHTSSDEITAHTFGSAALYECAATTKEEKARIAKFISKIADHIIRNNWYLIDADGKPTLWGRWNPEYVNWFPHTIVDRRLNSAEIIALLQFAHAITGNTTYKEKAMELLNKHGYLENIVSPMNKIALTTGYLHQGNDMGNEWNHSDDLLSFVAYYVLYKYAFNSELRAKYAAAIRDHWEIEKHEKNPFWNMVYASVKGAKIDLDGALWILRRFPLDMTDWSVVNSHRADITKLPPNFRDQQLQELLPPGERRITRWNAHPFTLDGGNGGHTELAGDEFLLPYWLGRYLKVIGPPTKSARVPAALP